MSPTETESFRYIILFSVRTHVPVLLLIVRNYILYISTFHGGFRMFVATWNVGGKAPNHGLDLEDFLLVEGSADIYVLGYDKSS